MCNVTDYVSNYNFSHVIWNQANGQQFVPSSGDTWQNQLVLPKNLLLRSELANILM